MQMYAMNVIMIMVVSPGASRYCNWNQNKEMMIMWFPHGVFQTAYTIEHCFTIALS